MPEETMAQSKLWLAGAEDSRPVNWEAISASNRPLVVAYGVGLDSTGVLVGMHQRGIRPDKILFGDVGAEKDATYAYLNVISPWLEYVGFPPVTVVRYVPQRFKHWPPYYTLEENCLTNGTLPSIAFGFSSCSQKWKQAPQHKHLQQWEPAIECWAQGQKVIKAIGYDCSVRDKQRSAKAERLVCTYKDELSKFYEYWYPLQEWGWDRERIANEIRAAGLEVPVKSSCFFCLAMKPSEVAALPADKLRRIVLLEARAMPRLTTCEGLWRKSTKTRSGSMTEFIRKEGLLSEDEIARIQQVPDQLIEFQQAYSDGEDVIPLGVFLNREFPEMYPRVPDRCEVVEVEITAEEQQPTLFGAA
jgi:hypothetical protein